MLQSLRQAGENVALANSNCSQSLPAWPAWRQKQLWLDRQIAELQQPSNPIKSHAYRRQLVASAIAGTYDIWGGELSQQGLDGNILHQPTCATFYFKLGFDLAYATQTYRQANEAYLAGNLQSALRQLNQAHLRLAKVLTILRNYRSIQDRRSFSILCADIRLDVLLKIIEYLVNRPPSFETYADELRAVSEVSDRVGTMLQANCVPAQGQREGQGVPIPVDAADPAHFVGHFLAIDPTRPYAQYHSFVILYADGTGRAQEWLNNSILRSGITDAQDSNGYGLIFWRFDRTTGKFTFDWTCGGRFATFGYFEGLVTGNTNDFTLSGRWSDGKSGRLKFTRQ